MKRLSSSSWNSYLNEEVEVSFLALGWVFLIASVLQRLTARDFYNPAGMILNKIALAFFVVNLLSVLWSALSAKH